MSDPAQTQQRWVPRTVRDCILLTLYAFAIAGLFLGVFAVPLTWNILGVALVALAGLGVRLLSGKHRIATHESEMAERLGEER